MPETPLTLTIDPGDEITFGPCEHCGCMTSRVWGYIERGHQTLAAYYVEWTPGHQENSANFDFIYGKWGENTTAADRQAVALEFRRLDTGPAFRLIDAADRPVARNPLVSAALAREAVINTPLANQIFTFGDLIYAQDPRIEELRTLSHV